jgi:hypothetical protein
VRQNSAADQVRRWKRTASGSKVATSRFFAAVALAFDRAASLKFGFDRSGQAVFGARLKKPSR